MLQLLALAIGVILLLILGILYISSKEFVRAIARQPHAVDTPMGNIARICIGCVLLIGSFLCGIVLWQEIAIAITPS